MHYGMCVSMGGGGGGPGPLGPNPRSAPESYVEGWALCKLVTEKKDVGMDG